MNLISKSLVKIDFVGISSWKMAFLSFCLVFLLGDSTIQRRVTLQDGQVTNVNVCVTPWLCLQCFLAQHTRFQLH